jgi:hypothetical protein
VKRRKILERDAINPRIFDDITEEVLSADANFVIDTGASAFVELYRYLLKNAIPEHVVNAGKRFIAHVIITGGVTFIETSANLEALATHMPPAVEIVVWLNDHFGPVIQDGRRFEVLEIYKVAEERIAAIVHLNDHTIQRAGDLWRRCEADDVHGPHLCRSEVVASLYLHGEEQASVAGTRGQRTACSDRCPIRVVKQTSRNGAWRGRPCVCPPTPSGMS